MMSFPKNTEIEESRTYSLLSEQQAEKDLISHLFSSSIIKGDDKLIYLLSKFPIVPLNDRSKIVCDVMDILWPDNIAEKLFDCFKEFELFLSSIGKRDHFFHQFLVYLIGLNIIQLLISKCDTSKVDREKKFGFPDEKQIFLTWLMTSSLHDFGYPYEFSKKISIKLSELYQQFHMVELSKKFTNLNKEINLSEEKILTQLEVGKDKPISFGPMIKELLLKYSSNNSTEASDIIKELEDNRDHGYISSLILCRAFISARQKVEPSWDMIKNSHDFRSLEYAMSAITLHNISEKYQPKISFEKNIYAYLLFILDNIQDWARVFVSNGKHPTYKIIRFDRNDIKGEITLDYYLQSNAWTPEMIYDAKLSLNNKKNAIGFPQSPSEKIGITFKVRYFMFGDATPIIIQSQF